MSQTRCHGLITAILARIAGIPAGLVVSTRGAEAHALAQRYDLPLPFGYFLAGAGAAVGLTFLILALGRHRRKTASAIEQDRFLVRGRVPTAIVIAAQAVSVLLFALIVAAGLFGHQDPFKNLAPVAVWVIWWVGFAFLSAFVGNFWALLNPFAALFGFVQWLALKLGYRSSLALRYPPWLGAWPAYAFLWVFAWLELVAPGRDVPRNIAIAMLIYAALTFAGFVAFGRDRWLRSGEVFSLVFGLYARFAPLHFENDLGWRWKLRPYASGLRTDQPLEISMVFLVILLLGTLTVDGFMETPLWSSAVEKFNATLGASLGVESGSMLLATALLIAGPLQLAALFFAAIAILNRLASGAVARPAGIFVLSLVPIAIAYHLAHYFSLLAIAGQFIIPLASDPFGFGWDLFGTTLYRIDIGIVDARFVWYLGLVSIVTGHMIGVWLAHISAFELYPDARMARRSQYPMVLLMIGYTMLSLWILAQPIIEPST